MRYYVSQNRRSLFDRLVDDLMYNPYIEENRNMYTDIVEKDDHYLYKTELPGYDKNDVKISLDNGYLTIEANKSLDNEDKNESYIKREIYYGTTSRKFYIGNVDKNNISANFENGILNIKVPKEEMPKNDSDKYITID